MDNPISVIARQISEGWVATELDLTLDIIDLCHLRTVMKTSLGLSVMLL